MNSGIGNYTERKTEKISYGVKKRLQKNRRACTIEKVLELRSRMARAVIIKNDDE